MEEEPNLPEIHELELHRLGPITREPYKTFLVGHSVEWREQPSKGVEALLLFPPETVYEETDKHPDGASRIFLVTLPDGAYFYWFQEPEGNSISIYELD